MVRHSQLSSKSADGALLSAEKLAPISFTRFRKEPAADVPAQSAFVSQLAELNEDLKLDVKPSPRIGLPKRL